MEDEETTDAVTDEVTEETSETPDALAMLTEALTVANATIKRLTADNAALQAANLALLQSTPVTEDDPEAETYDDEDGDEDADPIESLFDKEDED